MYIPDFACGVIATILVEIGALIIWAIYNMSENEKGSDEEE